jgi:hypothetical protein
MKERPILFSGPMVRAILAGTKTQTRRVVKPRFLWPIRTRTGLTADEHQADIEAIVSFCPYGVPGDRLWVRETFCVFPEDAPDGMGQNVYYRADPHNLSDTALQTMQRNGVKWRPSIFMPRSASRILLEITDVRVERLQAISGPDCWAEGIEAAGWDCERYGSVVECYRDLWEKINGAGSWDANPWVWVVLFRRLLSIVG